MKTASNMFKTCVPVVILILFSLFTKNVNALNLDSTNYKIQFGNVNMGSQDYSSTNYNLTTTLGQTAAGQFSSAGYYVLSGFQYIYSIVPFRFSVSNISINLGTLTPDTFATGTTTLTVYAGGAHGYQVTALEETPLTSVSGATTIPNTLCDAGDPCTTNATAKVWTTGSRNGFGYNMSGNDIPADFINSTYYRPFANRANNDPPEVVMSNIGVVRNKQAVVTMKVSVSGVQAAGTYRTIISFVATPKY